MTQNTTDQTQDNEHIKHRRGEQPRPTYTTMVVARARDHAYLEAAGAAVSRVTVTEDAAAVLAKYKQVTGNDGASRRQGAL